MTTEQRYKEAISFLFSRLPMFSRVGAAAYKPGLQTSIDLDNYFGNPHRRFKSVHVAGTNGKGSTSHILAAVLQSQGYRTALYTSPHLVDFRERMRIDGKMIPKEAVVDFVDRWKSSGYEGSPSFFELTMMMAFDWFARENVDYAVIETGMGGRLDSTNIISPLACVITNISADHTQFLGDTLPAIAAEKAGIIKKGIPVVVGEAEADVRQVFERKAAETEAPVTFAEDHPRCSSFREAEEGGWHFNCREGELYLPLGGDYQKKNINTALSAVDALRSAGITLSDASVAQGFAHVTELTGLAGRWMRLGDKPLVIADTGHNIAGISYNMEQLRRLKDSRPDSRLHIVIGFVADKDIDHILGLLPRDARYHITNAQIPRALPASELRKRFNAAGLDGAVYPCVREAYAAALAQAAPDDIVFVGGSTFIVADLLEDMAGSK